MFKFKRKATKEHALLVLAMMSEFERGTYGFYLYDELYYAILEGLKLSCDDWDDIDYAAEYFRQKRMQK